MKQSKMNMVTKIMIAVVLGLLFGVFFSELSKSIKIIGDIFLRLIQMSIPLLVFGQIVEAVARLNPKEVGGIGKKTIAIFAGSSFLAAVWGILMALVFKPGKGVVIEGLSSGAAVVEQHLSLQETILGFIPNNIMGALASGSISQIIVFSILFGIAFSLYRQKNEASKLLEVLVEFNEVIIKLITLVMKMAPLGIFSLIAALIGQLGLAVVLPLLKYLLIYGAATLSFLMIWILFVTLRAKLNPVKLIKNMTPMSIMALATTSSAIPYQWPWQMLRTS